MAGTGKSTISRTVAQSFADKGVLGASFFFKRGERDRGDAARLFPTIASQLVVEEPAVAAHVRAAIDADPHVTDKPLKEQFDKLVLEPLGKLKGDPSRARTFVLVQGIMVSLSTHLAYAAKAQDVIPQRGNRVAAAHSMHSLEYAST